MTSQHLVITDTDCVTVTPSGMVTATMTLATTTPKEAANPPGTTPTTDNLRLHSTCEDLPHGGAEVPVMHLSR